jgi:hypothetical protein
MADAKKKPARRAVNGSQKGSAFERLIAKQLSLWVSVGASTDLFWRSASSGARSTVRFKKTGKAIEAHASDIAPIHADAEPLASMFVIECKNYKSLSIHQVFYSWDTSPLATWWAQATRDADRVLKVPMLVVKENLYPPLVVLPTWAIATVESSRTVVVVGPGVGITLWKDLLATPFTTFRDRCHVRRITSQELLPSGDLLGPAPHRQRVRRVPLVDF